MEPSQLSPQARLWQLGLGFANTSVLHALVKSGVIERLRAGPSGVPELAQAAGLDAGMLSRTLRFAAALGVVAQDGEQYRLTDVGRLLLEGEPGSMYQGLMLIGAEPWRNAWGNFMHSLTTGESAFEPVMGANFFDYLGRHPEYGVPFDRWQTTLTTAAARAVSDAYDFTPFASICDVGGGQGILLKSILAANPHLHGILYDQESVTKDHLLVDLAGRVDVRCGDFFERVPGADALLMKNVLHDWSDEKCDVILRRCREAMRPQARLLVVEMVIATPADLMGAFYDLHMQVMLGGKERTEEEFRALLGNAGFTLQRVIATASPLKILEATL